MKKAREAIQPPNRRITSPVPPEGIASPRRKVANAWVNSATPPAMVQPSMVSQSRKYHRNVPRGRVHFKCLNKFVATQVRHLDIDGELGRVRLSMQGALRRCHPERASRRSRLLKQSQHRRVVVNDSILMGRPYRCNSSVATVGGARLAQSGARAPMVYRVLSETRLGGGPQPPLAPAQVVGQW